MSLLDAFTAMPSTKHPRPEGFHSVEWDRRGMPSTPDMTSGQDCHDDDEYHRNHGEYHRLYGHDHASPLGTDEPVANVDYTIHPCNHLHVNDLYTEKGARGHGYASALMDDLYARYPHATINHGGRTPDGKGWWSSYTDPGPERSISRESQAAVRTVTAARSDPDLAWHLTATWHDVRAKAKRILAEGGVHIASVRQGIIGAQVKGDHGIYETHLSRMAGRTAVASFECGCRWAAYAWDRTGPFRRYEGRMCSHALALHYATQSRRVTPDRTTPGWLQGGPDVITRYDPASRTDVTRVMASHTGVERWPEDAPITAIRLLGADLTDLECPHCSSLMHTGDQCPMPGRAGCSHCGDPWHDDEAHHRLYSTGHGEDTFDEGFPDADYQEAPPTPRRKWSEHLDRCDHCNSAFPAGAPLCGTGAKLRQDYVASEAPAHTANAEMSLGETIVPNQTPGPHPTKPRSAQDNPASSGWASGPDPDQWSAAPLYPLDNRLGMVGDDAMFEATLHDHPEGALPSTDGADINADDADPEALTPMGFTAARGHTGLDDPTSAVADTLAAFQAAAAHLDPSRSGGAPGGSGGPDFVAAARDHLAKTALRDFSPGERRALIDEGEGLRAANSDRLQLAGTHYAELEELLAADDQDGDHSWLS